MKKQSWLGRLIIVTIIFGVLFLLTGIALWIVLTQLLKYGYLSLDSAEYSIFYYSSIVAVTIGLGLFTFGFSISSYLHYRKDKGDDLKNQTFECLEKYSKITSSIQYNFVDDVIHDLDSIYNFSLIKSNYLNDPNSYYFSYLTLINTPNSTGKSFTKNLIDIIKTNISFINLNLNITKENDYLNFFVAHYLNVIRNLEPLCYEYVDYRVVDDVFASEIMPRVINMFLNGYLFVELAEILDELQFIRFSIRKYYELDNII